LKILILKPSSLGDVVQALPVLRLLKAHNPRHQIYWWIAAELASLLQEDPDLTGFFVFQRQRWSSPWHWGELLASIRDVQSHHFDWVIDLQGLARSSLFCWLARGNLTVGLEDWREGAPGLYDAVVPRPSYHTHAVDWYLQVLHVLKVPVHWDFVWIPPCPEIQQALQARWHLGSSRWMIVNPGARWLNKRWPAEYFAKVVREVARTYSDLRFAIVGAPGDRPLGAIIAASAPARCLDLTGRTTLPELIEWIRAGQVVLSNDTGPMHIAAALGKPVISLFGPTEPNRTGPYGQNSRVLSAGLSCAPCLKPRCRQPKPMECLHAITPETVCAALRQTLPPG
jgi:heptosyltransferase I